MKILIPIIMALFLLGCSDYVTDKAQQREQQEAAVGEIPDEEPSRYEETQEQEMIEIPLAEDSNYADEDTVDETMIGD
ncbi:MAG: hypothetical protein IBX43_10435 [Campylobacterales bacterium]|nr:hypothetical protein [Campylobacterales bacterium]